MSHLSILELIGIISIIVVAIYISVKYEQSRNKNDEEDKFMMNKSWTFRDLRSQYEESVRNGKPIMTSAEYEKKKAEILDSKEEKEKVHNEIKKIEESDLKRKIENRRKRKIGYKYEDEIFQIFYDDRELRLDTIFREIRGFYVVAPENYDPEDTYYNTVDSIFNLWIENSLIEKCYWSNDKFENDFYEVGKTLTDPYYRIDEEDIILQEWLDDYPITLKPHCKEYDLYIKNKKTVVEDEYE